MFKEWSLAEHVNRIGLLHRKMGSKRYHLRLILIYTLNFLLLITGHCLSKLLDWGGLTTTLSFQCVGLFFTRMVMAVTYSRLINKIPWSPEMMTGIWSFEGQPNQSHSFSVDDYRYLYFTCLAYGLKGMNFYMLADRDNWIDSPINGMGGK